MTPKTRPYFTYGMNLHPDRNHGWAFLGLHELPGYEWFINSRGVAGIKPNPAASVWGGIFALAAEDEAKLDPLEGYPIYYRKELLAINSASTLCYVAVDKIPGRPRPGYLEKILEGATLLKMPNHWIKFLETFRATDPS